MEKQPLDPDIPDKLYFPIREVARILDVEAYVLRFWEKEFPMFHPAKGGSGHRRYRRKDIEVALEIKRLLYNQGFTIDGARNQLRKTAKVKTGPPPAIRRGRQAALPFAESPNAALGQIRKELTEILTMMDKT